MGTEYRGEEPLLTTAAAMEVESLAMDTTRVLVI